jgi:hypothetical protein
VTRRCQKYEISVTTGRILRWAVHIEIIGGVYEDEIIVSDRSGRVK